MSDKITADTEVNTTALAVVLGVTARRVQQLAQDGTFTPVRRGRFLLSNSVQQYITFLSRERTANSQETEKLDAEIRIKQAKAVMADLHAQELQGKMHRSEDVLAMTEDLIYAIRGMLLALPGRLAVDAASLTDTAEISELVRTEIYTIMDELSRHKYDSQRYEERVRQRMSWDSVSQEVAEDE